MQVISTYVSNKFYTIQDSQEIPPALDLLICKYHAKEPIIVNLLQSKIL